MGKSTTKKLRNAIKKAKLRLAHLGATQPNLLRRCGDKPCCQAITLQGKPCSRPAMSDLTYIESVKCCYLCWQHSLETGIYTLYKLATTLTTRNLSLDEYCTLYPDECKKFLGF
jgi:hypothetical protein